MIRAGPVGKRVICDDPIIASWEELEDFEWDEKGRTMISHIYVSYDDSTITSIQFGYLNNGSDGAPSLSKMFGSSDGNNIRCVTLNQDEFVTGLSGAQGQYGRIKNLTFHTNFGEHGPIGSLNDKNASGSKREIYPGIRDRREFGGFYGSSTMYRLSSIGIYASPIARLSPIARSNMVVKRESI